MPLLINQTWSIDFMSDSLNTGRKIRTFNVIDDYNRGCPGIEVDHSLPAQRVIKSLATQWMWVYNNERPYSSIGGVPPRKLLEVI